jgi:hypothetical protein
MENLNGIDIKLLRYLAKHGRSSGEALERRFAARLGGNCHFRLSRLQNDHLIVYYEGKWMLSEQGLFAAQNHTYNDHRVWFNRFIDFGLGFVSGVIITLVSKWLLQFLQLSP